jgi:hypothetical protein
MNRSRQLVAQSDRAQRDHGSDGRRRASVLTLLGNRDRDRFRGLGLVAGRSLRLEGRVLPSSERNACGRHGEDQ